MNEIARVLLLRPPAPSDPVVVNPSVAFAAELEQAQNSSSRRAMLKAVATGLVNSPRGLRSLSELVQAGRLLAVMDRLESAAAAPGAGPAVSDVEDAMVSAFGQHTADVVSTGTWAVDRDRLADNLLAAKLLSRDGAVEARRIEDLLRTIAVVERVAARDARLNAPGAVRAMLNRPTVIGPASATPRRDPVVSPPPMTGSVSSSDPTAPMVSPAALTAHIDRLESLATALGRVPAAAFASPDPALRPPGRPATSGGDHVVIAPGQAGRAALVDATPGGPVRSRLLLARDAADRLSGAHRVALQSLGLDLTRAPVPMALAAVTDELARLHRQLAGMAMTNRGSAVLGTHVYDLDAVLAGQAAPAAPAPGGAPDLTAGSLATLKPIGIGDLLVVRQQLVRYEGGELSYIDNILPGELKSRSHERSRTTEETITVEDEILKEEERDSQTEERFELKREAEEVIQNDTTFKVGASVAGSYGPVIEFKASTEFEMNHSKEESTSTATSYAKNVTNRAASKVSQRHREQRILKTIEVFKEHNEHTVDNSANPVPFSGVYQWVDKVYRAQVFNYGRRMMFDIMVPEPGSFWITATANTPKPGAVLTKPDFFNLSPGQITPANYQLYVHKYQVTGVKPPPVPYQTVAKTFDGASTAEDGIGTKAAELGLPDGYHAVTGSVTVQYTYKENTENRGVRVSLGRHWWGAADNDLSHDFTLDEERGSVPVAVITLGVTTFYVTVEVDCQSTPEVYAAWQLETHSAIQQAYLALRRDYDDAVAALATEAEAEAQGRNPAEYRLIERAELKRQAISVITEQQYNSFGAISNPPPFGFPEVQLPEAEVQGRYVRFFEQAFEWEQMMYLFYPYYWGRKAGWLTRVLLQDTDQQFAEFLKAGAGRLVVPVRPGFEAALAHFLDTGEIWNGADPPTLSSPLYVSIIDEIKERTQAPGDEVAQGEPWEIRLPTNLVRLRADGSLPQWTQQVDGSWVEG